MPFYKQLGAEINILYGYTLQNIKTTIPIYFILLSNNFISISLDHIALGSLLELSWQESSFSRFNPYPSPPKVTSFQRDEIVSAFTVSATPENY